MISFNIDTTAKWDKRINRRKERLARFIIMKAPAELISREFKLVRASYTLHVLRGIVRGIMLLPVPRSLWEWYHQRGEEVCEYLP
jgi:hypothetical protein